MESFSRQQPDSNVAFRFVGTILLYLVLLTWRNLEGYPAQPGLTWRNLEGYPAQWGLICSSVCLSVCGWVRAKSGIWSKRAFMRMNGNFFSACVEGILQLFTNFYLHRKLLIFLRNDHDCKAVDPYNTGKRYAVIDSLDLMRNIPWLASCFQLQLVDL